MSPLVYILCTVFNSFEAIFCGRTYIIQNITKNAFQKLFSPTKKGQRKDTSCQDSLFNFYSCQPIFCLRILFAKRINDQMILEH